MAKQKTYSNENDVKDEIKKQLKKHGWFHWSNGASAYGAHGKSDIMALRKTENFGRMFLAIEAKFGKNTPTPAQRTFLNEVEKYGGVGMVVNEKNIDRFTRLLERLQ